MNRTVILALLAILSASAAQAAQIIVNQSGNSLGYSALTSKIYASVPFSASTNANSLMPVDPLTGLLGTAIPIGTRLGQIAVSSDSTYVYVVANDGHGVQRYNAANDSLDQSFNMPGSGQFFQSVRQLYAIPGQPDSLLIERGLGNFSPPAVATGVWTNGVERPQTVGTTLGSGGPDILAIDPGGVKVIGYQNTVSSFGTWRMEIDANGIHQTQLIVNGPVSGFGIGRIATANDKLYDNQGKVYDANNNFALVGSFTTSGNFAIDAALNRLFSVDPVGSATQVRVYDLATLEQLATIPVTGFGAVSTANLIRVGSDGLAFTTAANQIVILHSTLIPEPPSRTLGCLGILVLCTLCPLKRQKMRRPRCRFQGRPPHGRGIQC